MSNSEQQLLRVDLVTGVREDIKRRIITGELEPGKALRVAELAHRLGVSSSPIREALRLLERDGLVEIVPFRGARVRPLSQLELKEVYEIRELLEEGALRKVGPHFPAASVKELEAACAVQQSLDVADRIAFLEADIRFHQAIVDMARNTRMSEMFATLVAQGICFALGRDPEQVDGARQAHVALLNAIRDGDTGKAIRLLRAHLSDTLNQQRNRESRPGPVSDHVGRDSLSRTSSLSDAQAVLTPARSASSAR